jgi:hypothetical protein
LLKVLFGGYDFSSPNGNRKWRQVWELSMGVRYMAMRAG